MRSQEDCALFISHLARAKRCIRVLTSSSAIPATAPLHLSNPYTSDISYQPCRPISTSKIPCTSLHAYQSSLRLYPSLLSPPSPSPYLTFNVAKVSIALILMLSLVDHAGKGFISLNTSRIGIQTDLSARQSMALLKTVLHAAHSTRFGLPALYASR